jgi:hypothetical protein
MYSIYDFHGQTHIIYNKVPLVIAIKQQAVHKFHADTILLLYIL